jgi:hypothetical protein
VLEPVDAISHYQMHKRVNIACDTFWRVTLAGHGGAGLCCTTFKGGRGCGGDSLE